MPEDIITRVGWDTSPAAKGQKEAIALAEGYATKAKAAGAVANSGLFGGGMGAAAGVAMAAIVGLAGTAAVMTKQTVDHFGTLQDQIDKLGATAESMGRLELFGSGSGKSAEDLTENLLKLNRALADPDNDKGRQALSNLGVEVDKLATMQPDRQIVTLAAAFQKAQQSGKGLTDLYDVFGKHAGALIPVLRQGTAELTKLGNIHVLSADEVKKLDDMGDSAALLGKRLTIALGGAVVSVAGEFEFLGRTAIKALNLDPVVTAAGDGIGTLVNYLHIAGVAYENMFAAFAGGDMTKAFDFGANVDDAVAAIEKARNKAAQDQVNAKKTKATLVDPNGEGGGKKAGKSADDQLQGKLKAGDELKLLAAKATGNQKLIAEVERQLKIEEKKKSLMKEAGLDAKSALSTATLMADLEEKAAKNGAKGGRHKIHGGVASKSFTGMEDFYAAQRTRNRVEPGHGKEAANPYGVKYGDRLLPIGKAFGGDRRAQGRIPSPPPHRASQNTTQRMEQIMTETKQLLDERLTVAK